MYFHVDQDAGSYIAGWLITDNPGEVPELSIRIPNRKEITFSANVFRPDLRELGMHSTGQAGFLVDYQHVPDLADVQDISLVEPESGITIYKRFNPNQHIEKKLLLVDVSGFPQIKMTRQLMSSFTQAYPVVERLPLETITGLLSLTNIRSIFVAGSPNWQRHGEIARERGFITAALLRDPFEEMAEKLLFLSQALRQPENIRASPAIGRFMPLLPYLENVDLNDARSILATFRKIPNEVRQIVKSPMTATFGATPDEQLQRRNVSVALDNLAQFNVVGVRSKFEVFCAMLDEYLGTPIMATVELSALPGVTELASRLGSIGVIADLLDEDIALYSLAVEAIEAGLRVVSEE